LCAMPSLWFWAVVVAFVCVIAAMVIAIVRLA
jgi:hypothetical protein